MQPLPYLFDCSHMYAPQSWQMWNLSPRKSAQKQQNCFSTVRKASAGGTSDPWPGRELLKMLGLMRKLNAHCQHPCPPLRKAGPRLLLNVHYLAVERSETSFLVVGTLTNGTIGHILLLGIFDNLPVL